MFQSGVFQPPGPGTGAGLPEISRWSMRFLADQHKSADQWLKNSVSENLLPNGSRRNQVLDFGLMLSIHFVFVVVQHLQENSKNH